MPKKKSIKKAKQTKKKVVKPYAVFQDVVSPIIVDALYQGFVEPRKDGPYEGRGIYLPQTGRWEIIKENDYANVLVCWPK